MRAKQGRQFARACSHRTVRTNSGNQLRGRTRVVCAGALPMLSCRSQFRLGSVGRFSLSRCGGGEGSRWVDARWRGHQGNHEPRAIEFARHSTGHGKPVVLVASQNLACLVTPSVVEFMECSD